MHCADTSFIHVEDVIRCNRIFVHLLFQQCKEGTHVNVVEVCCVGSGS